MPFKLFRHPQEATAKCPHCHEDILKKEPTLFIGKQPFHRNCWIQRIMGPAEKYGQGIPVRQDTEISASKETRRA